MIGRQSSGCLTCSTIVVICLGIWRTYVIVPPAPLLFVVYNVRTRRHRGLIATRLLAPDTDHVVNHVAVLISVWGFYCVRLLFVFLVEDFVELGRILREVVLEAFQSGFEVCDRFLRT